MPPSEHSGFGSQISLAFLLWQLLLLAGALSPTILLWRKLSGRPEARIISPSPLEVREAVQYVTKAESYVQHAGVIERLTRIEAQVAAMQVARATDLDQLRSDMRTDVQRLHERIDELPDRIIAMLRNTGAIHDHPQS